MLKPKRKKMKKVILSLLVSVSLFADIMEVDKYRADILSKKGKIQKIELSMVIDGDDLLDESHKFYDGLNIVLSSFYVEDLFTSKGKEKFKRMLIKYLQDKYTIGIDDVFLQNLTLVEDFQYERFLEIIRKEGLCR